MSACARAAVCARLAVGLCVAAALAAPASAEERVRLRYGWAAGQVWRATQSIARETRLADDVQRDRGVARFEYRVSAGKKPGELLLEARMLSQENEQGPSALDFSPIAFRAQVDARGLHAPRFEVEDAAPAGPLAPGVQLESRAVLRKLGSAWRDAVLWFPELPERELERGEAFAVQETRDLAETEAGVAMRIHRTRTYRLRSFEAGVARFELEDVSRVDAATAESGIASEQRAVGEARFDLALGMWLEQQQTASQHDVYKGAPGVGPGEASAQSSTEIRMERVVPAPEAAR